MHGSVYLLMHSALISIRCACCWNNDNDDKNRYTQILFGFLNMLELEGSDGM